MTPEKAAEELKIIRTLMERPIRYSTQSGLSGLWAGGLAVAGSLLSRHIWTDGWFGSFAESLVRDMISWSCVFFMALGGTLLFARIREKRHGIPAWSPVKRKILQTILPPFIAGAGLTLATIYQWYIGNGDEQGYLIPAIWMLFYGVGVWQLGEFTNIESRIMGAAFIGAGVVTAFFFQNYAWDAMIATFGGFHIIYGIWVFIRYGG